VVDEERMKAGHWLVLVLCVSFGALTPMISRQEKQPVHTKPQSVQITNLTLLRLT